MHPHRRPGGYADEYIIIVPVPQPKWETQVVANAEVEAQASPFDRHILTAWRVVLCLAAIRKEMVLVITLNSPLSALPSVACAPQSLCSQQAIAPLGECLGGGG